MDFPRSTTLEQMGADYPVLRIRHERADARIALHGGHVMEWAPKGHTGVLFLSPCVAFIAGEAIRGGVPICWPWFGKNPKDPRLPQHGFVRSRFWSWHSVEEDERGVIVRMELRHDGETFSMWPHPFHLMVDIRVGRTLEIHLVTRNTGGQPFAIGGALHTYLRVGDIARCRIEGLEGARYLDTVGSPRQLSQCGPVTFEREVDRIYRHAEGCRIIDEALGRRIDVTQIGTKDLVIWNPWKEKAARLKGLPPDGFHHFLCAEAANADGDLPTVAPDGIHEMGTVIRPHRL